MRLVFTICFVMVMSTVFASSCHGDVGWALRPRSVIKSKVPGEIRVMVIDTGIYPHTKLIPWLQFDGSEDFDDHHGHGTHVTGIILYGNDVRIDNEKPNWNDTLCTQVKIFSCKYFDPTYKHQDNIKNTVSCIRRAIKENIDVINYSGGGLDPNEQEYDAYVDFVKSGGVLFTVAGNEHSSLKDVPYYPASYSLDPFPKTPPPEMKNASKQVQIAITKFYKKMVKLNNFFVAGNVDRKSHIAKSSNWSDNIDYEVGESIYSTLPGNNYGWMTGTSQAIPALLHKQLKLKCEEVDRGT